MDGIEPILEVVQREFRVGRGDILVPTRSGKDIAWARQVAMYLAYHRNGRNFTAVGRAFNRDRTTVRHAVIKVQERVVAGNEQLSRILQEVRNAAPAV